MSENPRLDPNQYSGPRTVLRILGPLILTVGVIFMIVGFVDFFGSANSFGGGPELFWCFFVGMPLLFVGGVMTATGYQGAILRYHAGESAPVLRDTFNYVADGTKSSVKDMAAAVGAGLSQGLGRNSAVRCHKCNAENPADAKFCNNCGAELGKAKPCPECNEMNDPDARFCDNCGKPMAQSNV